MSPVVVHISGPRASGKTTLARILAVRSGDRRPHYLRFYVAGVQDSPPLRLLQPIEEMASVHRRDCRPELVFEEVLEAIRRVGGNGERVIVETDTEPCFRNAYPYDVKLFIMSCPAAMEQVFRRPGEAMEAIGRALDDTTQFAAEVFGMPPEGTRLSRFPGSSGAAEAADGREAGGFLPTDVGADIASRLHLQPAYQPLLDSDVVVFNEGLGEFGDAALNCSARIEALFNALRRLVGRRSFYTAWEPLNTEDPMGRMCLERIEELMRLAGDQRE
jgi:hypothetical protein